MSLRLVLEVRNQSCCNYIKAIELLKDRLYITDNEELKYWIRVQLMYPYNDLYSSVEVAMFRTFMNGLLSELNS